jgi:hypothetical protein
LTPGPHINFHFAGIPGPRRSNRFSSSAWDPAAGQGAAGIDIPDANSHECFEKLSLWLEAAPDACVDEVETPMISR